MLHRSTLELLRMPVPPHGPAFVRTKFLFPHPWRLLDRSAALQAKSVVLLLPLPPAKGFHGIDRNSEFCGDLLISKPGILKLQYPLLLYLCHLSALQKVFHNRATQRAKTEVL
jgi:hypothetical protein